MNYAFRYSGHLVVQRWLGRKKNSFQQKQYTFLKIVKFYLYEYSLKDKFCVSRRSAKQKQE